MKLFSANAQQKVVLALALFVLCAQTSLAQQSSLTIAKQKTFQLTVESKNGAAELRRDDVQLFENGKAQTITSFERKENQPVAVSLLIDTSGSVKNLTSAIQGASDFVGEIIRPGDEAIVISFDSDLVIEALASNDATKLHNTL